MATLQHQLVYRLQNHALDLPSPQTSSDALMILADTKTIPTIVQIPRQIPKQELLKLMPMEWLSNYEKFHQNSQPIHTSEAFFEKRDDVSTAQENIPICSFSLKGYPIYPDKLDGHFLWDVPGSHMCNPDCPCLEEESDNDNAIYYQRRQSRRKKKSVLLSLCKNQPPFPPHDLEAKTETSFPLYNSTPQKHKPIQTCRQQAGFISAPQPLSCMMFSSTSASYQEKFPSLEKRTNPHTKVTTRPFVPSPVTPNGQTEEPRPFETVLNWQSENARAQNSVLQRLDAKVDSVASQVRSTDGKVDSIAAQLEKMYLDMKARVSQLDLDFHQMIKNRYWGPEFDHKEAKIRKLKAELE
ncbi:hypothetical protein KPL71_008210 [Citrus sinensis]|nr:hypothetical protein KPL71_008210 [Citrus sinensis]